MPYSRSRARKRFEAEISQVLGALREAFSSKCSSPQVRELAMYGAILLASAKVESYIEDLIADWGSSVRSSAPTTEKLPTRMRAYLLNRPELLSAYRKFVCFQDEREFLSEVESFVGGTHYEFGIDTRSVPTFDTELVYKDRKFPSPRNIKRLFDRFGFTNVFGDLNRVSKRDVEALLTSFNDLRNEMAHVGKPVGLTHTDIRDRINEVQSIVGYIDRVFYQHTCKSVGNAYWTV